MESKDPEDEMKKLHARRTAIEEEIRGISEFITKRRNDSKENNFPVNKYEKQSEKNVENSRESEAIYTKIEILTPEEPLRDDNKTDTDKNLGKTDTEDKAEKDTDQDTAETDENKDPTKTGVTESVDETNGREYQAETNAGEEIAETNANENTAGTDADDNAEEKFADEETGDKAGLWQFREAVEPGRIPRIVLGMLVVAGYISIFRLLNWWFKAEHVASLPFFLLLTFTFWWGIIRTTILWTSYLYIFKPKKKIARQNLSVAIFTTSSPGEPLSMFEKTLEACAGITYPHTTYLLDDTRDPRFREVAEKHGAVWLELVGLPGAKAGKINGALKITSEEFILVLDPDHIPFPNFFDEVLGFFNEEKVGFVQVSQAYYNQYKSFTATGAAEQTYSFYGPTQMGLHGLGSAVAIGSNCTFRRKALESIGGHGIGLAEDMTTAIRIHAAGWKSIYTPIIVSRGLVPEDLGSFCKQQLKWARGVHEVLFAEVPRLWMKLSFWQRISYLMIGTYYFSGVTTFFFLVIPYLFFFFKLLPANMDFIQFLIHWVPLGIIAIIIYMYVQKWTCHPETERGFHWRGMVLKFACWPVFFKGFVLSLRNAEIPYIPTAKQAAKGFTRFARPLIFHLILFVTTLTGVIIERLYFTNESEISLTSGDVWGMVAFAALAFFMVLGGIYAAWESKKIKQEDPWVHVDLKLIKTQKLRNAA